MIGSISYFNRFKPQPKVQVPVAGNATLAPPVFNIPFEATNTATINIKGYALPNTTVEIYLDEELRETTKTSNTGEFSFDNILLLPGTNNIHGKTVDEKGGKSFSSKPIPIILDTEKIKLSVQEPQDNQTVSGDKKVSVQGNISDERNAVVTVNGIRAIVDSQGNFSQVLELRDGDNEIVVVAYDEAGNTAQITRKVTYQPSN